VLGDVGTVGGPRARRVHRGNRNSGPAVSPHPSVASANATVTTAGWICLGVSVWLVAGAAVGVFTGRRLRRQDSAGPLGDPPERRIQRHGRGDTGDDR
jgi:hypothetical protein